MIFESKLVSQKFHQAYELRQSQIEKHIDKAEKEEVKLNDTYRSAPDTSSTGMNPLTVMLPMLAIAGMFDC